MKKSFILLIILFLINLPSLYYSWYIQFSWVDTVQHFLGGFLVAMFMSYYLKDHLLERAFLKNMLIVIGVTTFVGVAWEFSEYIANLAISPILYDHYGVRTYFMGDLDDTMNDLLMDILGAGLFALILHFIRSRKTHQA